jgi:hypothetical protein
MPVFVDGTLRLGCCLCLSHMTLRSTPVFTGAASGRESHKPANQKGSFYLIVAYFSVRQELVASARIGE